MQILVTFMTPGIVTGHRFDLETAVAAADSALIAAPKATNMVGDCVPAHPADPAPEEDLKRRQTRCEDPHAGLDHTPVHVCCAVDCWWYPNRG